MKSFDELRLSPPIRQAISTAGYTIPTPIQAQAIPALLKGMDLLGSAQTGTGKTAAFALPILQRLSAVPSQGKKRAVRALILTPTRELAAQIMESFRIYGRNTTLKTTVVFGGVGRSPQVQKVRQGVDILVATPGRLLDLMNTNDVNLKQLEVFVLDEADRMLDMGFIHDVKRVIKALPNKRQSLFFSATMPKEVASLAKSLLSNPVRIEVTPQATPVERIDQSVLFVDQRQKDTLLKSILADAEFKRVLVFTRTKHRANRVVRKLTALNISADAIHGNKAQNARTKALESFRGGNTRVLVATDIASRGIDIDDITHVINYELPNEPESYVHRIGRTARAGNDGNAISFCSGSERVYLKDIERMIGQSIKVVRTHPCHSHEAERGLVDGGSGVAVRKQKLRNQGRPQGRPKVGGQQTRHGRPKAGGQQTSQRRFKIPAESRSRH